MRRRPTSSRGMLAAAQDYEIGGMQLPCVVEMAANSFFAKAGIGIGGGGMLTSGNANLLMVHGTPLQQEVFAKNEFAGRFSGTMCLSEPQAGSQPVRHRDARGARRRRLRERSARPALPPARQQDVDLERRARADREHRPPRAGQDSRRRRQAGSRHARHLALHRAEEAGRRATARSPASATTSRWPASTTSSATAASQHAAQLRRRQVPGARQGRARSATWSASPARACAACST